MVLEPLSHATLLRQTYAVFIVLKYEPIIKIDKKESGNTMVQNEVRYDNNTIEGLEDKKFMQAIAKFEGKTFVRINCTKTIEAIEDEYDARVADLLCKNMKTIFEVPIGMT